MAGPCFPSPEPEPTVPQNPITAPPTVAVPHRRAIWLGAFALTAALLAVVQLKVARPMLLAERYLPGAGWAEALLLSVYAAWVADRMADPRQSAAWRKRIWLLFSAVFFGQLFLGLAGASRFLMSGRLHLPVPALIVAGPLYRGEGFFMPILFATTLLVVGPAWCSHLCYIGSWDLLASTAQRRAAPLPGWREPARVGVLVLVVLGALGLRLLGAGHAAALAAGALFGLVGVAVLAFASRRPGAMVHCTLWCPMGLIAAVAGRLSPFRIRVGARCNRCNVCARACRHDALGPEAIARGRPGLSCTLCGDCVAACPSRQLQYRWLWLEPATARALFVTLVAALHAVFLGLARL
jgi:polyferredoxin